MLYFELDSWGFIFCFLMDDVFDYVMKIDVIGK